MISAADKVSPIRDARQRKRQRKLARAPEIR